MIYSTSNKWMDICVRLQFIQLSGGCIFDFLPTTISLLMNTFQPPQVFETIATTILSGHMLIPFFKMKKPMSNRKWFLMKWGIFIIFIFIHKTGHKENFLWHEVLLFCSRHNRVLFLLEWSIHINYLHAMGGCGMKRLGLVVLKLHLFLLDRFSIFSMPKSFDMSWLATGPSMHKLVQTRSQSTWYKIDFDMCMC